jgi:hypothetical protein
MTHEKRTAVHAARMAKCHGDISGALKKCCGMAKAARAADAKLDPEALLVALQSLVESFDEMQSEGEDYSEACDKASEANAHKAADARDAAPRTDVAPLPAGFTKIAPKAIPRTGAPSPSAKPDPLLSKIAGVLEEDQHPAEVE